MNIIKMMGGLGNQMFQYAFGRAQSEQCYYDLSWFDEVAADINGNATVREYALDSFALSLKIASEKELCLVRKRSFLPKMLRKVFRYPKYPYVVRENGSSFDPMLLNRRPRAYYEGYFQCERYFLSIRHVLLRDFSLKCLPDENNRLMLDKIQSVNAVSLHVRRGDYVNLQAIHGLCSLDYYARAIQTIASKVAEPHFFLFSDDIDWVKAHLAIPFSHTIVDINDGNKGHFDIELMKHCKHNIIANSSFSWWGAWLNNHADKIVVAPKVWFSDGRATDIIPEQWLQL